MYFAYFYEKKERIEFSLLRKAWFMKWKELFIFFSDIQISDPFAYFSEKKEDWNILCYTD